MAQEHVKDPQAVKDYKFDWSLWLATGDAISDHTITADTGLTVDSSSITDANTSVTVWLSGGTVGANYNVTCQVETAGGRTDERTMKFYVRNQ